MPRIRTIEVSYTVEHNQHKLQVNIMYDPDKKIFYVAPPKEFHDCIDTMSDELKDKYFIKSSMGIRAVNGYIVADVSESVIIDNLKYLFNYCGNAVKKVRKVIVVFSNGVAHENKDRYSREDSNREARKISQEFFFYLGIETKIGEGEPIYTYQNVTYTNTITWYHNNEPVIIDDTPENRAFLEDVYTRFNGLIVSLQKFFKSSDTMLELIASNQKLLG